MSICVTSRCYPRPPYEAWRSIFHYFHCDDHDNAFGILEDALCLNCSENNGLFEVTQEILDYIQTIYRFENGKLYFK
jgi:hypothetical protein